VVLSLSLVFILFKQAYSNQNWVGTQRAFDDRSSADYGFRSEITKETAEKAFNRADDFIKHLKEYLKV